MTTQASSPASALEAPLPGLHASPPEELPFARGVTVRAFLLERDHGNLLVYSAGTVPPASAALRALGGVARHCLNHWHEAMFGVDRIAGAFGAPVVVHAADAPEVARRAGFEPVTFSGPGALGEGLEVVPTPGHTPGASTFLYERGDHRFLFTGDTVYLRGGEWVAAVLPSSDRVAYVESLERLREVDFDVLVPWAADAGAPFVARTGRVDARRRIDAILRRLRAGGSS